jgi:hypothetical protein
MTVQMILSSDAIMYTRSQEEHIQEEQCQIIKKDSAVELESFFKLCSAVQQNSDV